MPLTQAQPPSRSVTESFLTFAVILSWMFRDLLEDLHAAPNMERTGMTDIEMHRLNRRTTQRSLDFIYSLPRFDCERDGALAAAHLVDAALFAGADSAALRLRPDEVAGVMTDALAMFGPGFWPNAEHHALHCTWKDKDFTPRRLCELKPASWDVLRNTSPTAAGRATASWGRIRRSTRWRVSESS